MRHAARRGIPHSTPTATASSPVGVGQPVERLRVQARPRADVERREGADHDEDRAEHAERRTPAEPVDERADARDEEAREARAEDHEPDRPRPPAAEPGRRRGDADLAADRAHPHREHQHGGVELPERGDHREQQHAGGRDRHADDEHAPGAHPVDRHPHQRRRRALRLRAQREGERGGRRAPAELLADRVEERPEAVEEDGRHRHREEAGGAGDDPALVDAGEEAAKHRARCSAPARRERDDDGAGADRDAARDLAAHLELDEVLAVLLPEAAHHAPASPPSRRRC